MNENIIKDKIKALDTNNIIADLFVYNRGNLIQITSNTFECYYDFENISYYLTNNILYSEKDKVNNIKILRDTLDFLENNLEKIKVIIKEVLECKQ